MAPNARTGRSRPLCASLSGVGRASAKPPPFLLVSLSCSRSQFFRDNGFANRGQRNTGRLQVLFDTPPGINQSRLQIARIVVSFFSVLRPADAYAGEVT